MASLANLLAKYPEMARWRLYLAIGIGFGIGRLNFRGVGLGEVTGSLPAGILLGNLP
jgi:putative transport protein